MAATMQELGIDKWSEADRWKLLKEIHESIGESEDVGGNETEEEKRFIDERLAAVDNDPRPSLTWEETKEKLWGRK